MRKNMYLLNVLWLLSTEVAQPHVNLKSCEIFSLFRLHRTYDKWIMATCSSSSEAASQLTHIYSCGP